jgi:hypothetical protein
MPTPWLRWLRRIAIAIAAVMAALALLWANWWLWWRLLPPMDNRTALAIAIAALALVAGIWWLWWRLPAPRNKLWEVTGLWTAALVGPVVAVFAIVIGNHAATLQIGIAADSEQKQLRAYIFSVIETPLTDFSAGEKRYSVVFANGGSTPAYDLFYKLYAAFIPLPFPMPFDQYSAEIDLGRGPPGDYLFKEHTKRYTSAAFVLTPEQSNAVKDGKGGVFFFGGMSYTDIFGCRRHAHFCSGLWSQRGSAPAQYECVALNDVDDPNKCEKVSGSRDLP